MWVTASHDVLAAACLYIAALRAKLNKPGDLVYTGTCLCVDPLEVQEGLIPGVTKLLIDLDVRIVLAAFIPVFDKMSPKLASKSKDYASMALKLRMKVNDLDVFMPGFQRNYWLRIVASGVFAVMLRNKLTISICWTKWMVH